MGSISTKKIVSNVVFYETNMLRKCEDKASTDSQKGKRVVDVEFDNQSSFMDKSDNEQFFRSSQNEETYFFSKRQR
jgi:hypothetical protein